MQGPSVSFNQVREEKTQHQVGGTASGVPDSRTFYKRALPCPPAVAFSSSEGGERYRRYKIDELHE